MKIKIPPLAEVRKAIVNVVGLAAMLVTLGFVHGSALAVTNTVIAVLTALVHYQVRNDLPPASA